MKYGQPPQQRWREYSPCCHGSMVNQPDKSLRMWMRIGGSWMNSVPPGWPSASQVWMSFPLAFATFVDDIRPSHSHNQSGGNLLKGLVLSLQHTRPGWRKELRIEISKMGPQTRLTHWFDAIGSILGNMQSAPVFLPLYICGTDEFHPYGMYDHSSSSNSLPF